MDEETSEDYLVTGSNWDNEWNDYEESNTECGFVLEIEPAADDESESPYTAITYLADAALRYNSRNDRVDTWDYVTDQNNEDHYMSLVLDSDDRQIMEFNLNGKYSALSLNVSTCAEAGEDVRMDLEIWGDDQLLYANHAITKDSPAESFSLDLTGVETLSFQSRSWGSQDNAYIFLNEAKLYQTGEEETVLSSHISLTELLRKSENSSWKIEQLLPGTLTDDSYYDDYYGRGVLTDCTGSIHRNAIELGGNGSYLTLDLDGAYTSFMGSIRTDNQSYDDQACMTLEILLDGEQALLEEGINLYSGSLDFNLDLTGKKTMTIRAFSGSEDFYGASLYLFDTLLETAEKIETVKEQDFGEIDSLISSYAAEQISIDGYRYYKIDEAMSYSQAEEFCKNLGGQLAEPTDETQNEAIHQLVDNGNHTYYWLGGQLVGGFWTWNSGSTFGAYQNWGYNQPDNDEDIEYLLTMQSDGSWNDWDDREKTGFILEVTEIK